MLKRILKYNYLYVINKMFNFLFICKKNISMSTFVHYDFFRTVLLRPDISNNAKTLTHTRSFVLCSNHIFELWQILVKYILVHDFKKCI